jgi:DNA segregation ATPase FtsK/SpoIIIE-like protein
MLTITAWLIQTFNAMIPFILDDDLAKLGEFSFIDWNPADAPHICVIGASGSGKTVFCMSLLGRIALHDPTAQIYVCDFKGQDMSFLNGCDRYFRYAECGNGLQNFYACLEARQQNADKRQNKLYLYFDEWAAFCSSFEDKKQLEVHKRVLATLLMLSRSYGLHLVYSLQRSDATHFNTGARDNFSIVVGLGNLSQESRMMMFNEHKHLIKPDRKRGTGYMTINGSTMYSVRVPFIRDFNKLHEVIKQGVTR